MSDLVLEGLITLYQLDTTMLGPQGQMFYFASAEDFDEQIQWGGNVYVALPMTVSGFERSTKGAPAQPMITLSNIYGAANTLLDTYNGLIGARVSRILTLSRFLDGGSTPDPNVWISWDTYVVAQKTSHNALAMIFKLATKMDQEGTQLPRRLILRDICTHAYRFWNPNIGGFDYRLATCPYTGNWFSDANNNPGAPQQDMCSRTIVGCSQRFGGQVLPARFFPGVGKVK
jgi:lambda family phage minor tail protein L